MLKFLLFSFLFHLLLLIFFKLNLVDIKINKEKPVNINLSQIIEESENKQTKTLDPGNITKSKKKIEPSKTEKKIIKEKITETIKPKSLNKKVEKKIKDKEIKKNSKKKVEDKIFDDMLKNLVEKKLPVEVNNDFDKTLKDLSNKKLLNEDIISLNKDELNQIEKLLLNQINNNWSRPPGIKISKNLIIKIIITLNINGEVINLQIHKKTLDELKNNDAIRPYLDSSLRAIKKASPFEGLRKDRYNIWNKIIINFKPIETR